MNAPAIIRSWLDAALGFLYPNVCQICRSERAVAAKGFVGVECRSKVRFIDPPYCSRCGLPAGGEVTGEYECGNCRSLDLAFRFARSAVAARGVVLEAIHRFKYNRALWFEPFLADLLVQQATRQLRSVDWDWLVPVPLYGARQREREFNQAERIAARLSTAVGIPVRRDLLRRKLPTRTQTRLARGERAENMRGAFELRGAQGLRGRRIVVVDDVFTTGSTTSACARVLRRGGASDVCVWTVARGI